MTMNKKKGIFSGTDEVIAKFFGVESRSFIDHKTISKGLSKNNYTATDYVELITSIYKCLERNWSGKCRSSQNWRITPVLNIGHNNTSPEVMLERAFAQLSANGHIDGWVNQVPVVSGLVENTEEGRRAIDLLYLEQGTAEFVELKWATNTPIYAAMEILEYGIAYLFSRQHQNELGYTGNRLMALNEVTLSVLAPLEYYSGYKLDWLTNNLEQGIKIFSENLTNSELSMRFEFQAFPSEFSLPFENGAQVNEQCNTREPNATTRYLVDMLSNRVLV